MDEVDVQLAVNATLTITIDFDGEESCDAVETRCGSAVGTAIRTETAATTTGKR